MLFLFKVSIYDSNNSADSLYNLYVKWNASTLASINKQISTNADVDSKVFLNSRLGTLASLTDSEYLYSKSLRYEFLQAISKNIATNHHYFVIESNKEGEQVEVRNFLIINNENYSHVFLYKYHDDWEIVKDTIVPIINFRTLLNQHCFKNHWGRNQSEIILSEFISKKVNTNYFMPFSINQNNILFNLMYLF